MSESKDKTVGPVAPPPQEASLARLKQSLESARSPGATELSRFLAERLPNKSSEPVKDGATLPASAYELGRILAKGGMGAILSARDNSIQRTVAVKVILTGAEASDEHVHRLVTEARITGQLEHPNIVPLHELGVTQDGVVYYTMRLVEGVTLSEVLEQIRQRDKAAIAKYPLRTLLTVFQKVCDAVAFAHSRGVIHRDLKPDNLMLGEFGEVFVMDWGLAKRVRGDAGGLDTTSRTAKEQADLAGDGFKTLSGQVKGTPRYMAPEQAEGRVEDIDERTDIYALGAILYAILTLHPPVTGDTVNEVLTKVASGAISPPTSYNPRNTHITRITRPLLPLPPEVIAPPELAHCPDRRIPSALSAVVMKALSRDQTKRYQSVSEFQRDIEAYQAGYATAAEHASALRLLLLLVRRHRTEFILSVISLGLMVALAAHFTRQVTRTLAELKETAPTFYVEARTLVDELKFAKALAKINYAISLQPNDARFHALKGNILQSLLQLAEARDAYARALELDPENLFAERNLQLCDRLLAANEGRAVLKAESLNDLRTEMSRQQRTAEVIALTTRMDTGFQNTFEAWKAVVKKIGFTGSLRRDAGGLSLTIQQPDFNDLAPFRNAPLTKLHLMDTQVDDLGPLQGMPLTLLDISNTRVADLSPLRGMRLTRLDAARVRATNFSMLTGMKLVHLNLAHTRIANLAPLRDAPLRFLQLEGCTNLTDIAALANCQQLEGITLPVGAKHIEALKQLPRLRHIGYVMPEGGWDQVALAEDFWKARDNPGGK